MRRPQQCCLNDTIVESLEVARRDHTSYMLMLAQRLVCPVLEPQGVEDGDDHKEDICLRNGGGLWKLIEGKVGAKNQRRSYKTWPKETVVHSTLRSRARFSQCL